MLFKLAVKNIVSRKSSFVIIAFIAFAVALFVLSNSIFDNSERGVENLFISGFTGDFMIRPVSERPYSLFGDETPIIGDLSAFDKVVPFAEIADFLEGSPEVAAFSPQLSGSAFIENPGERTRRQAVLFAVNPESYVDVMDGIRIVSGEVFSGKGFAMLNSVMAEELGVSAGDEIQFVIADGWTFRIRSATVSGIYRYADVSDTLDRICLLDVETFASLMDVDLATTYPLEGEGVSAQGSSPEAEDFSVDELFFGMEDVFLENSGEETASALEDLKTGLFLSGEGSAVAPVFDTTAANTSWHFITGKLADGKSPALFIHALNKVFRDKGWPVEAVNWRHAGGASALYLYWLRVIVNAGIFVVLVAGLIVINNTLVINVLSRSKEIGTMRAIGASRFFISRLFMAETFMLAVCAGVVGSVVGWLAGLCVTSARISFSNQMLSQLFGGKILTALVSYENILDVFILVLILGVIAWIYPVKTALSTSPTVSMQGEKG